MADSGACHVVSGPDQNPGISGRDVDIATDWVEGWHCQMSPIYRESIERQ